MSRTKYSTRVRRATALAFILPIAASLPLGYLLRDVVPGQDFRLVLAVGLLVIVAAFAACIPWWRAMDDMQKQGHMLAWYWGGMAGGLVMLIWLIAALGMHSPQALGALALLMAEFVGFLLFWGGWMWRKRGAGE
jgi:uncharacterized membrane protein YfcA